MSNHTNLHHPRSIKSNMKILFLFLGLVTVTNSIKAYELKLKRSFLKGERYEFACSKFIDARLNKQKAVGYTRRGVSNKIEELKLPKNFAAYCDTLFGDAGIKYEGVLKLIPVITQITIQETHNGSNEFSHISLAMNFYMIENDSCFLYYSSFTKVNSESGFDITAKHGKYLTKAFSIIFNNLNVFTVNKSLQFKPLKINIIQLKDTLEITNNTFHEPPIKDGIYFSCRDLVNNEPSETFIDLIAKVDTSLTEVLFYESVPFFRRNSFFAFVKGNCLYLHLRDLTFHKANMDERNRLAHFKNLKRSQAGLGNGSNSVSLGYMFGLVGIAIETAIRYSKKERPEELNLDLEIGLIDIAP